MIIVWTQENWDTFNNLLVNLFPFIKAQTAEHFSLLILTSFISNRVTHLTCLRSVGSKSRLYLPAGGSGTHSSSATVSDEEPADPGPEYSGSEYESDAAVWSHSSGFLLLQGGAEGPLLLCSVCPTGHSTSSRGGLCNSHLSAGLLIIQEKPSLSMLVTKLKITSTQRDGTY